MAKRKIYDSEFKQKAVELSFARGSAREVAEELGISEQMLYRWRKEFKTYKKNSFPGRGKPKFTEEQKEIAKLKKQLHDAEMERDILKKAISIFSTSDRKSLDS